MNIKNLLVFIICSILVPADVNLSIDNFIDDGAGIVTFDIMMTNTAPVGGFQFNFLSGNGVYDSGDNCRCDQGDDALPVGCDECYYDYGMDKVRNNREEDTSTWVEMIYGCQYPGICLESENWGNFNPDLSECEENAGICSDSSILNYYDCLTSGYCANQEYSTQCECETNGDLWISNENYWTPSNFSYIPFQNVEECISWTEDYTDNLRWDYYNPDGNRDNYESSDNQRCHVPQFGYESAVAGHCSEYNPICVSTGEYETSEMGFGILLNWDLDCCINTNGGRIFEPWRDKDVCEGIVNFGTFTNPNLYSLTEINGDPVIWEWTSYDDESTCETHGGFWYGSENGTDDNGQYDVGEYFIDADASLAIASGSGGSSGAAGFFISANGSTALGINFTGAEIPVSETPVSLATFTASYSGLTEGDIFELLSMTVCGTGSLGDWLGTNCPNDLIFSDSASNELETEFTPSLWTVGTGISSIASDDGICSSIGGWGEDSEDDSTCDAYCGDGHCNHGETFDTCSVDCESYCGDGVCSLYEGNSYGEAETAESCYMDCSIFGCGDFICSEGETYESCSHDCYASSCGDGNCDIDENIGNCSRDCGGGCTDWSACNFDIDAIFDDGSCAYEFDCWDECGGTAEFDCNDICDGNAIFDVCGVCDGDNSSCLDDCGIPNGDGTSCIMIGDINNDAILDILDIVLIVNIILDAEYDIIADLNEDDIVDILDIVRLVNWIIYGIPEPSSNIYGYWLIDYAYLHVEMSGYIIQQDSLFCNSEAEALVLNFGENSIGGEWNIDPSFCGQNEIDLTDPLYSTFWSYSISGDSTLIVNFIDEYDGTIDPTEFTIHILDENQLVLFTSENEDDIFYEIIYYFHRVSVNNSSNSLINDSNKKIFSLDFKSNNFIDSSILKD